MADRLEWFDVTIPAGTPIAAPVTTPLVFPQGEVVEIDVKVLDGPCGSVGFFIAAGGTQYVPRTPGSFIRPNDDYFTWPLQNAINSGSFGITAYNLDSWPHNLQVGFQVNESGLSPALPTGSVGVSSDTLLSAITGLAPPVAPSPDPLSPASLLASVPSDVINSPVS